MALECAYISQPTRVYIWMMSYQNYLKLYLKYICLGECINTIFKCKLWESSQKQPSMHQSMNCAQTQLQHAHPCNRSALLTRVSALSQGHSLWRFSSFLVWAVHCEAWKQIAQASAIDPLQVQNSPVIREHKPVDCSGCLLLGGPPGDRKEGRQVMVDAWASISGSRSWGGGLPLLGALLCIFLRSLSLSSEQSSCNIHLNF